jgi:hypothetical protein
MMHQGVDRTKRGFESFFSRLGGRPVVKDWPLEPSMSYIAPFLKLLQLLTVSPEKQGES